MWVDLVVRVAGLLACACSLLGVCCCQARLLVPLLVWIPLELVKCAGVMLAYSRQPRPRQPRHPRHGRHQPPQPADIRRLVVRGVLMQTHTQRGAAFSLIIL